MAVKAPKINMREEILERSTPLFAKSGYDGVSMRDVAVAVGVTPAALYYHFSDKERLYLDVVDHVFKEKANVMTAALDSNEPPWMRLESFIFAATKLLATEKDFQRMMQWILMDSDEHRRHKLADEVFKGFIFTVHKLAEELGQGFDPNLLSSSIFGLVAFPFEAASGNRFLPGYRPEHEDPAILARHIIRLLRQGLSGETDNN